MPEHQAPDREKWFVESDDSGSYGPVHRKGCLVFAATFAWIFACGIAGMVGFLFIRSPWVFVAMLATAVPGLLLMARTIRRHS